MEAYVADLMKFSNAVLRWDLSFMRVVQDQGLELLSNVMDVIYSAPLRGSWDDKMCWKLSKSRGIEVEGNYWV